MSEGLTYDSLTNFGQSRRTVEMPGPRPQYEMTLTPEQEARLPQLSPCSRAPFALVQRAQMVLLAHQHPQWQNAEIARRVGCSVSRVKRWRQRWQTTHGLRDAPRAGPRPTCPPLQRTQLVAWACRAPRQ
jgi:hypothetical protein